MRVLTLSNGKSYDIHPLTIGQLKALEKIPQDEFEDRLAKVCEVVGVPAAEIENFSAKDALKLQTELYNETFGSEDEVKN